MNTLTAPDLSGLLDKELDGMQTLTLDFKECDYVSSAGLRVLLATYKQMKAAKGSTLSHRIADRESRSLNSFHNYTIVRRYAFTFSSLLLFHAPSSAVRE